jgi:RNA polymerase sigma factor (sigma-70 family)
MTATDMDLLRQFAQGKSQDAFTELVGRHVSLVYSSALRQVRSPQLAEEVAQAVFIALAQQASRLRPDTVMAAWLYATTHGKSIDLIRREARRQAREQIAMQLSDANASDASATWARIEPFLDEAMNSLEARDRAALLLRYFENKSLRDVGSALGTSEDAAQKRISRALEKLREYFSSRKVAIGTAGLATLLSAHAIEAAPIGLAATITSGAVVASAAATTSTLAQITQLIAMTTLQKTIITTVLAASIGVGVYEARQVSTLRDQVKNLEQQKVEQETLAKQARQDRDRVTNKVAALSGENATLKNVPAETLKLRGEVGRLRQENSSLSSSSALNKITANPESRKMLREQQKMGMGALYRGFQKQQQIPAEKVSQFNDLLADHIMDNVDHVTTSLRDKLSPEQMNELFSSQEAQLNQKVQELLGPEAGAQYQDYTHNLISTLCTEQFGSGLGDEKAKKLEEAMMAEMANMIATEGLPSDYQAIPILNFRNIASETQGDQSLKFMDDLYAHVATKAEAFLSAEELVKFQEYRKAALENSRVALTMNRTMMAPIGK